MRWLIVRSWPFCTSTTSITPGSTRSCRVPSWPTSVTTPLRRNHRNPCASRHPPHRRHSLRDPARPACELLTEERQLRDTNVEDVLLIGEHKAANYCYAFPFALGATLAGHPPDVIDPVVSVLRAIGTLSQVVDDLTGAFPGVIDNDKDTLGEIANLRRALPLVLLAHNTAQADIIELLSGPTPLDENDARQLREYLWNSDAPRLALTLCRDKLSRIQSLVHTLPIGKATATYLDDLVRHRLATTISHLHVALDPRMVR